LFVGGCVNDCSDSCHFRRAVCLKDSNFDLAKSHCEAIRDFDFSARCFEKIHSEGLDSYWQEVCLREDV